MQRIDHLLREHKLSHKKSAIMTSLRNSIGIEKKAIKEEEIPIGTSKLGGLPDMPDGMEFPSYENGYLWFIGQFNLKEAKPYDKDNLLPEKGILYLFYDAHEQPWGFEEDEGCYKVLYFDGDVCELKRRAFPGESEGDYSLDAYKIAFRNIYTISEHPENLPFEDENEEDRFWNFRQELMQPEDENGSIVPAHYMLGEPFNVQNDVFEELYDSSKHPVLLFQIDSDEQDLGVMWGDSGLLYFCIEKEELLAKQFDKVTFTLQCF
ncbi:YwqG family protein [Pseudobacillus sp. FSL P4-0506]|uniref:YwqG family protein n=1 Tax=unclassified Pseudobacillus TaxID=2619284 RepID=UPI0030F592F9